MTRRTWLAGAVGLLVVAAAAYKLAPRLYNAQRLERLRGRKVYDPNADAEALFARAQEDASQRGKRLLVVLGANWCKWCLALDDLLTRDEALQAVLQQRYVLLKLDVGAAEALDQAWGTPSSNGVPVLIFFDRAGAPARVQDSVPLQSFGGRVLDHDADKVLALLQEMAGT